MDVFVARQPIFDRSRQLEAYELLFRSEAGHNAFDGTESASATMQVMANSIFSIGLDDILCGKKAFLNFDRNLLMGGVHSMLPPDSVVLEILESVEPDAEFISACEQLCQHGYTIALDDFISLARFEPFAHVAKLIKVDLRQTSLIERQEMVRAFKPRGIAMLAEKVETHEEFHQASRTGFDLFQGYFFARPEIVRGRQIPASKTACLQLLNEIQRSDLHFPRLEKLISQDVSLCYKLLRYVNSPLFYRRTEVRSLTHALVVLGETGIRHWISLAALLVMANDKPGELVSHTLVRARFTES